MGLNTIRYARSLKNKRVLVRVDFNVAMNGKKVAEDSRLLASLPTIQYLQKKGAKIILVSHLGRPDGKMNAALKMTPVAKRLGELLKSDVPVLPTKNWELTVNEKEKVFLAIEKMKPGSVVMLENIRFSPHEQKDIDILSRELATLADLFVLDGFAVAHRSDASVTGVSKHLPSYAGLLLEKEITGLTKIVETAKMPFVAVMGGMKMESKVPVMKRLLPHVDFLLLGGAIVNTYFFAAGYGVGDSLVDQDFADEALRYGKQKRVIVPMDVIVGKKNGSKYRRVEIGKEPHVICGRGEAIFDIGPATIRLYAAYIKEAETLLWNGAMGWFEKKPFYTGTRAIARLIASRAKGEAFGVIGGGETIQAMEQVGMTDDIDLVSTGGGAMLSFLAGEKLPGIDAVSN